MFGFGWRLGAASIGLLLALSGPPALAQAPAQAERGRTEAGGRNPETRRHADLHDPGRRAAEL